MKYIIFIPLLLLIVVESFSQNVIDPNIKEKARIFYANEKNIQGTLSAKFAADYYTIHGSFPSDNDVMGFHEKWRRSRRDSLAKEIDITLLKGVNALSTVQENLLIWELKKSGGLPDSTFTMIMDKYYYNNKYEAIQFCLKRWEFRKVHQEDLNIDSDLERNRSLRNYPYLLFLFKRLTPSDLVNVLIRKNTLTLNKNQKFINLFLKASKKKYSKKEISKIYNFTNNIIQMDNIREINSYFFSELEKLSK